MASESDEILGLDRVLTRLALTEESHLEQVLSRLMPIVIGQLKSGHHRTRAKVLELLSHVNKRVKGHDEIKLPLLPLLEVYNRSDAPPLVRNFSLVYVEMAFERASPEDRLEAALLMLKGISSRSQQHKEMLLRMAVNGLGNQSTLGAASRSQSKDNFTARCQFVASESDRRSFMEHALKVLLYQPPATLRQTPALQQGAQAPGARQPGQQVGAQANGTRNGLRQADAAGQPSLEAALPVPPGLCPADVRAVEGKSPLTGDSLSQVKLGILNLSAAAELAPRECMLLYLVAAADPDDAIARRGEELSKKRCSTDGNKPDISLEDAELIKAMFSLFHGSGQKGAQLPAEQMVQPASAAVRARLMSLLKRSLAAANAFPDNLQAIFACVFETHGTLRLKHSGMEFAVWTFKHAAQEPLERAAKPALQGLLMLLENDTSSGSDITSTAVRGFTYQAIGQLASRVPALFTADVAIARRFFRSLSTEPAGVRTALQEAISTLASAYQGCKGQALHELEALLLESVASQQEAAKLCAAQWASRLFPLSHVPSRYVCVIAAGDTKLEVREAGSAGLRGPTNPPSGSQEPADKKYPQLDAVITFFSDKHPSLRTTADPGKPLALPHRSFEALVIFLRECYKQHEGKGGITRGTEKYLAFLENALVRAAPGSLQAAALEAILEVAAGAPAEFAGEFRSKTGWLQGFLSHVNPAVREMAARLLGIVATALSADSASSLLARLCDPGDRSSKFEATEGSLAATGFVLAQLSTGVPSIPEQALRAAAESLSNVAQDAKGAHAAAAALALGYAGLQGTLPLPAGLEAPDAAESTSPSSSQIHSRKELAKGLSNLMKAKDVKVAKKAVTAAGYLCRGEQEQGILTLHIDALLETAKVKSDVLPFAAGESLCFAFGGVKLAADRLLHTPLDSLAQADSQNANASEAEELQVDSQTEEGPHDAEHDAVRDIILDKILKELMLDSKAEVRSAACVWLVALCTFTGKAPQLLRRLPEIQEAFSNLLGDSSELAQEMASRGLSAVYQLGDEAGRAELLKSLMGTLQGGAKKRAVKLTGDSKVFEEGQLGEAPGGGSLTTYRELSALATEMGQPDLLYKFMDLANHATTMASTRGAAFGFASIAKLAGEQLKPYIAQLVPKLYRYQHDPNPRVRDAMTHIWRTLIDNPKEVVDEHFTAIVKEVLAEMGGRLWRNREAACSALSDLMQGRRFAQVQPHLQQMWEMTMRAMDDVKESCRAAAAATMRTLQSVSLRLADPSATAPVDAAQTVDLLLPFLLDRCQKSDVKEVQALCMITIAKMVQAAKATQIQQHLPHLVPALLDSLSGMEDQRLNYVEQHAERIGVDVGRLESARVSAAKGSIMGDTLDVCARHMDAAALEALVPVLGQLLKRGVGLNTQAGAARFISSLAMRLGSDLRPQSGALLKALMSAARTATSPAVRRGHAQAVATVAKSAPEPRAARLITDAVQLYTDPGDAGSRQLSGLLLRELVRGAPDTFAAHASAVLPCAFVACHDDDTEVAAVWKDVWEEGTGSPAAATRLHISEITGIIQTDLHSQQWRRKICAANAIKALCKLGGTGSLSVHAAGIGKQLLQEVPGRLWDGKEVILEAIGELITVEPHCVQPEEDVITALLGALDRKRAGYVVAALKALQSAALALPGVRNAEATTRLLSLAKLDNIDPASASKGEGTEKQGSFGQLRHILACLGALWQHSSAAGAAASSCSIAAALSVGMAPDRPLGDRIATCGNIAAYVKRLAEVVQIYPRCDASASVTLLLPGLETCIRDARYSQLRSSACAAAKAIVQDHERLNLSIRDLLSLRNTVHERAEQDPALKSEIALIVQSL
ncbi:hypothetical protein CVIRNUC_008843 [Coccomyxa viridis]|uniref:Uncharacterized protein n=1 Tax=Coccomyxa viridis TaxID=1274662 RepID=A0AAV1IG19_9CHLO|nr:hypothetical protein CVIRNUC_008843 [Coccomyxa viridis]